MFGWNTIAQFSRTTNGTTEWITPAFVQVEAVSIEEQLRLDSTMFAFKVTYPLTLAFPDGPIEQGDKIHWTGVPKGGYPLHTPAPDFSTGYATAYVEARQ